MTSNSDQGTHCKMKGTYINNILGPECSRADSGNVHNKLNVWISLCTVRNPIKHNHTCEINVHETSYDFVTSDGDQGTVVKERNENRRNVHEHMPGNRTLEEEESGRDVHRKYSDRLCGNSQIQTGISFPIDSLLYPGVP